MDLFAELEEATRLQYDEGELPLWLAEPILAVARQPERYRDQEYLIDMLLMQVKEYDVYAEAGCCKWASDDVDLKRTLKKLEEATA
jgi:hypothetical protein